MVRRSGQDIHACTVHAHQSKRENIHRQFQIYIYTFLHVDKNKINTFTSSHTSDFGFCRYHITSEAQRSSIKNGDTFLLEFGYVKATKDHNQKSERGRIFNFKPSPASLPPKCQYQTKKQNTKCKTQSFIKLHPHALLSFVCPSSVGPFILIHTPTPVLGHFLPLALERKFIFFIYAFCILSLLYLVALHVMSLIMHAKTKLPSRCSNAPVSYTSRPRD
jgi:hypothetical protein